MSEIYGLHNQQVLQLPHEIHFCDDYKNYSACMREVERGTSYVKFHCSKSCPTEMICIHNGTILTSRTFLHKGRVVSREILKGVQLECSNCHGFIRGQSDSYFCQYCNLPLCRRIACLYAHLKPCQEERERLMHDTAEIDSQSHFTRSEIYQAQDRALAIAKIKEGLI